MGHWRVGSKASAEEMKIFNGRAKIVEESTRGPHKLRSVTKGCSGMVTVLGELLPGVRGAAWKPCLVISFVHMHRWNVRPKRLP